jgi:hypothetical protein
VYTAGLLGGSELRIARLRPRRLVQVVILLAAVSLLAAGQAKPGAGSHAQNGFTQAADRVLGEGLQAKIPPHLSTLLGLSRELECPVKQGVLRTGQMVQGFDVSVENQDDIVLFVVNEGSNDQTLYLTSGRGRLRKVVSVKNGEGSVAKITEENKKAFDNEKKFWLNRLAPPRAPK